MTAKFCSQCGNSVTANDRFCRQCGQPISPITQPAAHAHTSRKRKKQTNNNLPLLVGLLAGVILIGAAIWFTQTDSTTPPDRVTSAPAAEENSGLPYPEVVRIDLADAKERFDAGTAVFVDTRDLEEYEAGHIPGAILMTEAEIEARHLELTTSPEILTYCT